MIINVDVISSTLLYFESTVKASELANVQMTVDGKPLPVDTTPYAGTNESISISNVLLTFPTFIVNLPDPLIEDPLRSFLFYII